MSVVAVAAGVAAAAAAAVAESDAVSAEQAEAEAGAQCEQERSRTAGEEQAGECLGHHCRACGRAHAFCVVSRVPSLACPGALQTQTLGCCRRCEHACAVDGRPLALWG